MYGVCYAYIHIVCACVRVCVYGYDIYKLIEEHCFEDDRVIGAVNSKFCITDKDWEAILDYMLIMIAIVAIQCIYIYIPSPPPTFFTIT